jgi:hypothetical protein
VRLQRRFHTNDRKDLIYTTADCLEESVYRETANMLKDLGKFREVEV